MIGLSIPPTLKKPALLSLGLHLLGAYFSAGYYAPDEHFQILEVLNAKLGLSPWSDLAPEIHAQARPMVQVALYTLIVKVLSAIGIANPFVWALWLRMLSSVIGWWALWRLILKGPSSYRTPAVIWLASWLWFLPALHARTSQENLGGSLLVLALSFGFEGAWFLSALALGFAGEVRYQLLAVVLPLGIWMLRQGSPRRVLAGGAASFLISRLADAWIYGNPVYPFWNYIFFTTVRDKLFTKEPVVLWEYFRNVTTESWPVLGILALLLCLYYWIKNPKNPLTLATAPLFLAHTFIAHKEIRFLFPMAHFFPFILAHSFTHAREALPWLTATPRALVTGLKAWNAVGLTVLTLLPARGVLNVLDDLWQRADRVTPETLTLYRSEAEPDPYFPRGLSMAFYRPKNLAWVPASENPLRWETARTPLDANCILIAQAPSALAMETLDQLREKISLLQTLVPRDRIARTRLVYCDRSGAGP